MAKPESAGAPRRKGRRNRTGIGSDGDAYTWLRGDIEDFQKPTLEELRNLRTGLYSGRSTKRRTVPTSRMTTSLSRTSLSNSKSNSRQRHKSAHVYRPETEARSHRRKERDSKDDRSSSVYVYGPPKPKQRLPTVKVSEKRASRRDDSSSESNSSAAKDGVVSAISEETEVEEESTKVNVIYVKSERPRASRSKVVADDGKLSKVGAKASAKSVRHSPAAASQRNSGIQPLDFLRRTLSVQEVRDPRPSLRRSSTYGASHPSSKLPYEQSMTSTKITNRHTSFFSIFTPAVKEEKPIRLVECLTCLSDDVPRNKSAKLKCGHRMCHSCLKRIFKLSVKDPQHMPPKCCTSDHIPLKHVDKLFDIPFKKSWNKKFQEYTTKNRIYCPARRCGEWIKPGNIHTEGGNKYGKCSRCKTKVCCLCNGKWHGSKECPKDEETNALLEAAKQAGWQRCYSCRTMVELKEGCNHMTCRCRAEFCMICGLKWKTCNCPWFNYDQVENDRLRHMQVPGDVPGAEPLNGGRNQERNGLFQRPGRPRGYNEELDARRRQELLDEELARRLHLLGIGGDDDDDLLEGIGNINGVGNARAHFMNEDFRRPAPNPRPANYAMGINRRRGINMPPGVLPPPPNPAPAQRAPAVRPAERLVPRRATMDYATEAARHAPLRTAASPRRARPIRAATAPAAPPRRSVLAGLGGAGRGSGRVSAWRAHVEPGIAPEEGDLPV